MYSVVWVVARLDKHDLPAAAVDLCLQTSLMSAIVGDMQRTEGEVTISGSVSYAPQNPW